MFFFLLISFSPRELFAWSSIILLIHQSHLVEYSSVCEHGACNVWTHWLWEAANAIKNEIIPFEIAFFNFFFQNPNTTHRFLIIFSNDWSRISLRQTKDIATRHSRHWRLISNCENLWLFKFDNCFDFPYSLMIPKSVGGAYFVLFSK